MRTQLTFAVPELRLDVDGGLQLENDTQNLEQQLRSSLLEQSEAQVVNTLSTLNIVPPEDGLNSFVGMKATQANMAKVAQYAHRMRQRAIEHARWSGTITSASTLNFDTAFHVDQPGATITVTGSNLTIENCRFTTGSGTAINFTAGDGWVLSTNTATGVANWIWDTPVHVPKWREEAAKNHRGVLIRSAHKERQWDGTSHAEMLALQLLRKMVSQEEFRRYLRHGHIHVRGDSGLVYQIGRQASIHVWEYGKKIASLCVHLKHEHKTPPTDEVVGKLLIVECDEPDIWQRANVTWLTERRHPVAAGKPDRFAYDPAIANQVREAMVRMTHVMPAVAAGG